MSKGATLAGPGLAAHGYDVVAFFTDGKAEIGSDKYAVAHAGGTYRFVSQAHLDAFKADPGKYAPAYGGFCAYGVALGKKFDGDPRYWKIVDGKLYLNLNGDIQAEWSKDIPATSPRPTPIGAGSSPPRSRRSSHDCMQSPASDSPAEAGRPPGNSMTPSSDIAFSPSVKAVQQRRGSRAGYAKMEGKGGFATTIDASLAEFIARQRSFYLATVNADGQPYIQHRGGPPGFLRVLDEKTLGFADFSGNRQYISTGNLADNAKATLFLMDYANRMRVKIWGTARAVENDPALTAALFPDGYKARAEQAIVFTVEAWDANCPQHIPQMFFAEDVAATVERFERRIAELEAENARLRAVPSAPRVTSLS